MRPTEPLVHCYVNTKKNTAQFSESCFKSIEACFRCAAAAIIELKRHFVLKQKSRALFSVAILKNVVVWVHLLGFSSRVVVSRWLYAYEITSLMIWYKHSNIRVLIIVQTTICIFRLPGDDWWEGIDLKFSLHRSIFIDSNLVLHFILMYYFRWQNSFSRYMENTMFLRFRHCFEKQWSPNSSEEKTYTYQLYDLFITFL